MLNFKEREERVLKMLDRIKRSPDGAELIEYLQELSLMNYKAFKQSDPSSDEYCKGYAVAIDSLIESFANCTLKLADIQNAEKMDPILEDEEGNPVDLHG